MIDLKLSNRAKLDFLEIYDYIALDNPLAAESFAESFIGLLTKVQ